MTTPYSPPAILTDVLGHLDPEQRAEFGEALGQAIDAIADRKAREQNPTAYFGNVRFDMYLYPWHVQWVDHDNGVLADVTVTVEEVLGGPDIESIRALRAAEEARERAKAEESERKRLAFEATKASALAKVKAAGLTVEEQVAVGLVYLL